MEEMFSRGWNELIARDNGPLFFRFIFQPLVAMAFAIRAGLRDAREHRPAFFWRVVRDPTERHILILQLWKDIGKLFLVAVVLDVVYQLIVLHWIYPVQTLIVATLLAIVPYLIVRGLTNRFITLVHPRQPPQS